MLTRSSFMLDPDDARILAEIIDEEFSAVVHWLGYNDQVVSAFVEIVPYVLHRFDTNETVRPTDDRLTVLVIFDYTVATVLERRDDFNRVQVTCATYLDPELTRILKDKLRSHKKTEHRYSGEGL